MTRILIDILSNNIQKLNMIAAKKHISRAELIRRALSIFIDKELEKAPKKMFGIFKDGNQLNSMTIQNKLRDEW